MSVLSGRFIGPDNKWHDAGFFKHETLLPRLVTHPQYFVHPVWKIIGSTMNFDINRLRKINEKESTPSLPTSLKSAGQRATIVGEEINPLQMGTFAQNSQPGETASDKFKRFFLEDLLGVSTLQPKQRKAKGFGGLGGLGKL
jgi:hypothetical protein